MLVDNVKTYFDRSAKMMFIEDVNVKFTFKSIVDVDAGPNICLSLCVGEFSLECNRYTFPSQRIYFSKSLPDAINNSFSSQTRLFS